MNASREWWANGPADDRDAMALEAAREELLGDEETCKSIAAKVRAEFETDIDEICSGAWSIGGAKAIAIRMCEAAEREINQRARDLVANWTESRALANVED